MAGFHWADPSGDQWRQILSESGGNVDEASERYWQEMSVRESGFMPKPLLPRLEKQLTGKYVAPWRQNSVGGFSQWFQQFIASNWATAGAYLYDWGTNVVGTFQTNFAITGTDINPFSGLGIVLIVGSLILCFVEIIGVQAWGRFQEFRKAETQGYGFEDSYLKFKWFYGATAIVMSLLAIIDLVLSAVPWAVAFGWTNPIGWVIGIALSFLIEFLELEGHTRMFHATRGKNQ